MLSGEHHQTRAVEIRDAAFDRVSRLTINGAWMRSTRKAPITTVQPDQLPALGVFVLSERETPEGNVTLPRFITNLELGISWLVMSSDALLIDGTLDRFVGVAKDMLFRDPTFLELFEFVEGTSREYQFSKEGEAYIAELRLRITVSYHTIYTPFAPNDLLMIDVKTNPAPGTPVIEIQFPEGADWPPSP
jgi:hypothetical protein